MVIAAFQSERNYRAVEHRYRAMARTADAVLAFADFPRLGGGGDAPVEVPLGATDGLGNEWAVVVDAPGYCACLLAWEQPRAEAVPDLERRFEAMWTLDPRVVRRAAEVGATLARRADADLGERMDGAAGRAAAGDGAAGALPDRRDEPDRRLLGRRLSGRVEADRADAIRLGEAELLGGRGGEVPLRLAAEGAAVDDGDHERP